MWFQSTEQIGGEAVGLFVEKLDDAERQQAAATLAWLTLDAMAGGIDHVQAWHAVMDDLLRRHVSFSLAEERIAALDPEWWQAMLACAVAHFLRENELGVEINRHVATMQWMARQHQGQC